MRLATGLPGSMGQVLQQGLWQGNELRGTGNKISSDKELVEVGRMAEDD